MIKTLQKLKFFVTGIVFIGNTGKLIKLIATIRKLFKREKQELTKSCTCDEYNKDGEFRHHIHLPDVTALAFVEKDGSVYLVGTYNNTFINFTKRHTVPVFEKEEI